MKVASVEITAAGSAFLARCESRRNCVHPKTFNLFIKRPLQFFFFSYAEASDPDLTISPNI